MTNLVKAPQGLPAAIQDALESHAFSETEKEVGGVLVGRLLQYEAEVTAFIPALKAEGSATNVTFTHDVWADVLDRVENDYPGQQIVGWYHTHPGFGLFLSEYDLFIHSSFFADERMVALVVDPLAGDAAWFGWDNGEIVKTSTFATEREAVQRASEVTADRQNQSAKRGRAGLLVVAAALVAGVGGFVWGTASNDNDAALVAANDQIAALEQQLQDQGAAGTGTAAGTENVPSESGAVKGALQYDVRPGDTWWKLSVQFYNDGEQWPKLQKANGGPGTELIAGETIAIPGLTLDPK